MPPREGVPTLVLAVDGDLAGAGLVVRVVFVAAALQPEGGSGRAMAYR